MPPTTELLETLRPLTDDPRAAALFLDVDGTLAPIVEQAERARVPESTARLLGTLGRRYGLAACVSGRSSTEAKRLVGVGSLAYAGDHGAELLMPGTAGPSRMKELEEGAGEVRRFAMSQNEGTELRRLRVRLEDKGPIFAFHWRGVPDEEGAEARVAEIARAAETAGLRTHWGRKVLEVRPPVEIDKGQAVRRMIEGRALRTALFAGDDRTDLDGFAALDALVSEERLSAAVCVGIASDEGPAEIVERADLTVDGVAGFAEVLSALAGQP